MASPASLGYIKMIELHDYVQFYLVIILFFVLWFYINILLDFGVFNTRTLPAHALEKAYTHILARKIAHIGWLEVVWTIIPILILTAIAIPSFKLLYALDVVNSPLLTLRCIGNQWYWTYECEIVKPDFSDAAAKIKAKYFTAHVNLYKQQPHPAYSVYYFYPDMVYKNYVKHKEISLDIINSEMVTNDLIIPLTVNTKLQAPTAKYDSYLMINPVAQYVPFLKQNTPFTNTNSTFDSIISNVELHDEDFDSNIDLFDNIVNLYGDNKFTSKVLNYINYLHTKYTATAESFAVDSYMLDVDDLQLGAFRLLEVDNYPQLPADAEIRLAVTGTDVIHSFAVPSLGVKIDAIPGRLNQFGIRVRSPGTYYGQCSELCGVGHGFMPIKVQFLKVIK